MTTHHITAPAPVAPTPGVLKPPITIEHVNPRCSWPLLAAIALAAAVGPATAWLLIYAPLTTTQRLIITAAVPVGLGLLGAASTLLDRETRP